MRRFHWNHVTWVDVISLHRISVASLWTEMLCEWPWYHAEVFLLSHFSHFIPSLISLSGMNMTSYAGLQTELWQLCWWMLTRQKFMQLIVIILQVLIWMLNTQPAVFMHLPRRSLCTNLTCLPAGQYHLFLPVLFLGIFTICRTAVSLVLHLRGRFQHNYLQSAGSHDPGCYSAGEVIWLVYIPIFAYYLSFYQV